MILEKILRLRTKYNKLDCSDREQFYVTPKELYQLCTELQRKTPGTYEYGELENCKQALIQKNYEIAAVAGPTEVYGFEIFLR